MLMVCMVFVLSLKFHRKIVGPDVGCKSSWRYVYIDTPLSIERYRDGGQVFKTETVT